MPEINYFWGEIEDNVIEEYDENGDTIVSYATEPTLYGSVLSQDRSGETRYFQFDGLGNTMELTQQRGNPTDTRRYTAFGELTEITGTTSFSFQYCGRWGYQSNLTSQIYVRHRFYSHSITRWLCIDPVVFAGADLNPYRYVGNTVSNLVDPGGLDWLDNSANFAAGAADSLTMGIHGWVRRGLGINDGIETSGGWYIAGEATEIVAETAVTLGAGVSRHIARRAVRETLEAGARSAYRRSLKVKGGVIHHINPIKGHPGGIPSQFPLPYEFAAQGRWNMRYVSSVAEHAAMHRRLRAFEQAFRYAELTQPIRNGGNLLIQHMLDDGPYRNTNNVRTNALPFVEIDTRFSGERTLFFLKCKADPSFFTLDVGDAFSDEGVEYFLVRGARK